MMRVTVLVALAIFCAPQAIAAGAPQARRPGRSSAQPTQTQAVQETRAAALERAAADLAAGRRAEAAARLRAIADKYGSVTALLQLARIQSDAGDAAGALASLAHARRLAPNAEDVLSAYAQVALAVRALPQAIVALEALARICPDVADHQYLLGIALMQADDMITAVEALQRAAQLEPDRPLTLIALGLALNNRKMYGEAAVPLQHALELEPANVQGLAALAEAEEGLGQSEAAETHARRVLDKMPDHATANLVLGLVLMRRGQFQEARDAFVRASRADPRSPKPEYQLSLAYARLGDRENSQKHLDQYRQKLRDAEKSLNELRTQAGLPPAAR